MNKKAFLRTTLVFLLCTLFWSCNQGGFSKSQPQENNNKTRGDTCINTNKKTGNTNGISGKTKLPSSPNGIRLGEYYGSDDNMYSFFCDDSVKFLSGEHHYKLGTWTMRNDSIIIRYHKLVWREGIGEPHKRPEAIPGNWQDTYDDYKIHHEQIDELKTLHWQEIREYLEKDPKYPYQVINQNIHRIEGFMENYYK
ncbi:MAG: hypothetical protein K9H84_00800 [Bacteroidales bacterium]|nr:hypothetical protein [Bacteroidales bacterium]